MKRIVPLTFAGIVLSFASVASADEPPAAPADAGAASSTTPTETAAPILPAETPAPSAATDSDHARLERVESELTQVREQLAAAEALSERKLLSFWGFMDTSFGGIHYDDAHALYRVQTPAHTSFFSAGVNLYAKSEMTRTLSALVEVRLTYSPDGYTNMWRAAAKVGSTTIADLGQANRIDTAARGPYSQLLYNQSGLLIERAHMDWKPADWFGVRVGRFLTPFGIWNEDHGSPVLLGVDMPQLMNFGLVPIWQLGLQAFGTLSLSNTTRLEYAATLTNTRGPYDAYKDTTDFKAVGGRLKFVYEGQNTLFRIGAYGLVSHYRETEDFITLQLTPGLTLDRSANPPFGSTELTNVSYDETVLTGDIEFRYKRFRIFGEGARQTVIYQAPRKIDQDDQLLQGAPLNSASLYDASHYGWAVYVLGAYEIPIKTKFANLTVTPYAGYDRIVPSTTFPLKSNTQIRAGLNVRPSPYVTLKLEGTRLLPESPVVASKGTAIISQLAVSF